MPRTLRLVIPLVFLAPSAAQAGDVTMIVRNVPLHARRAPAAAVPRFNMVGLHWQGSGTPLYRARSLAGRWSAWQPADDDWGRDGAWRKGSPDWTGPANAIQIRVNGSVTRVREYLLWSAPVQGPARRLQLAGSPAIVSRSGWQADESIRRAEPTIASSLQFALVHHTVNTNGYPCSESAAIVRGIEVYHVKGNGWNDIGYNFLVDRCGTVFEGRYGGIEKNVVGAHSQGFNSGSVGVALIGTYETVTPPQAQLDALVQLLAWRLDVAHIDPLSFLNYVSGGNTKFAAGLPVNLRAISGHRDTYFTDCPGDALYRLIPALAQQVAKTGTPKLYAPGVAGTVGGPIRFTGRLSESLPWTVTVTDSTGKVVAAGAGTGTVVDWTWDSKGALPGAIYTWVMSAGASVRPVTGTVGTKLAALTLTKVLATPAIVDGTVATSTTITYTLSVPANVTVELLNSAGTAIATLFAEDKLAGAQSFVFTPAGVPDGNYTIRLIARDQYAREAQASVSVTVSRTLLGFSVDSPLVSPNGDGRRDTATFAISLAQAAEVTLAFQLGTTSIPIFAGSLPEGNQELPWTGMAADGTTVPDGAYKATLTLGTPPLAISRSVPLTVDTRAPALSLVSLFPLRLKTDERASIFAVVNGHRFTTSAKPGVFRLVWPGTVRTLLVVARDAAGNDSQPVSYRHR